MRRVLLDASAAFDQLAGVGRYSRNIVDRLVAGPPEIDWTLFHTPAGRGGAKACWQPPGGARIIRYPLSRRRLDLLGGRPSYRCRFGR